MIFRLTYSLVTVIVLGLNGCIGPFQERPGYDVMNLGHGAYWFNYDASRRGAILAPKPGAGIYMCAEPAPDVALDRAITLLSDLSLKRQAGGQLPEAAVKAQADFSTKVVEIASRTQTILFLREAMYRLCEQQMNGALTPEDVRDLYNTVVETSVTLAEAQVLETLKDVKDAKLGGDLMSAFQQGQVEKMRMNYQFKTHNLQERAFQFKLATEGARSVRDRIITRIIKTYNDMSPEEQRHFESISKSLGLNFKRLPDYIDDPDPDISSKLRALEDSLDHVFR